MHTPKVDLKVFLEQPESVSLETLIPVFHNWIQTSCLDELLIDVADYRHVPDGPSALLIGHAAHYVIDQTDGELGLLYSRRRETHPSRQMIHSVKDRFVSVFANALAACHQLETEPSLETPLRFRTDRLLLRANDRLQAPNTAEGFTELQEQLKPFLTQLYPEAQLEVAHLSDASSRLTVQVNVSENPSIEILLTRLALLTSSTPEAVVS